MVDLIFCLMGPTAAGKTDLACELVKNYPFEIISVDSAMIYRGMDIGTAKPDVKILAEAPHHLINILDPPQCYSAANFCHDAKIISKQIISRGKIPLLVGGTMMYFRALQEGLSPLPEADLQIRSDLLELANQKGWDYMHSNLADIDPLSATRIHPHDTQRIQRALEVYRVTGKALSELLTANVEEKNFRYVNVVLMPQDRRWLHERIEVRFKQMLQQNFIEEVRALITHWELSPSHPSMRSVGYRQVLGYLQGEYDYSLLSDKGSAATRQLAKRQLTWLRHWPDKHVFPADGGQVYSEMIAIINEILDNSGEATRPNGKV